MSWSDVARACRKICVLRERGLTGEAEELRAGELQELLARLRGAEDTEGAVKERLDAVFAVEAERVANAAVLAELLAPMIAESMRSTPAAAAMPSPVVPLPLKAMLPEPVAAKPAARRPASIADFIDDMIAQESPPDPPRPAHRKAS